jgi:hypothetical protein
MSVSVRGALSDPIGGDRWIKAMLIGSLLVLLTPLIVPVLAVNGYIVRLHQRKAAGDDRLPAFDDWAQLTIDGLKVMIIGFTYALIPLIVFLMMVGGSVDKLTTGPVADRVAAFAGGFGGVAVVSVLGVIFAYFGVAGVVNFSHSGAIRDGFDTGPIKQLATSGDYAVAWLAAGPLNLAYTVTGGLIIVSTNGLGIIPVVLIKFYVLVVVGTLLGQAYRSVVQPHPNRPLDV